MQSELSLWNFHTLTYLRRWKQEKTVIDFYILDTGESNKWVDIILEAGESNKGVDILEAVQSNKGVDILEAVEINKGVDIIPETVESNKGVPIFIVIHGCIKLILYSEKQQKKIFLAIKWCYWNEGLIYEKQVILFLLQTPDVCITVNINIRFTWKKKIKCRKIHNPNPWWHRVL